MDLAFTSDGERNWSNNHSKYMIIKYYNGVNPGVGTVGACRVWKIEWRPAWLEHRELGELIWENVPTFPVPAISQVSLEAVAICSHFISRATRGTMKKTHQKACINCL